MAVIKKKSSLVHKARKTLLMKEIINELKSGYGITEKELTSGSVMYADARVTPEEIAPMMASHYGISLKKNEFSSWDELVSCLADAIMASDR